MSFQCTVCKKRGQRGNIVSHSKRRSKHIYRPNLRWANVLLLGRVKRIKVCMDCLSRLKKDNKISNLRTGKIDTKAAVSVKDTAELRNLNKNTNKAQKLEGKEVKVEELKIQKQTVKEKPVKKVKLSEDLQLAQEIIGGLEEKKVVKIKNPLQGKQKSKIKNK